jgi:uncharacterized membrane protein
MKQIKWVVGVLAILGVILIALAIVYYTVQAHSLPSFMGPIHLGHPGARVHRKRRGEATLVLGIVLLVVAAIVGFVARARNVKQQAPQQPV